MAKAETNDQSILLEHEGRIATVTLNRPAQRNCLSFSVLNTLGEAFDELAESDSVHVIILAAEGPAFCAGHDLKELTAARQGPDGGRAFFESTMQRCSAVMQKIVSCPNPVIAAVQGIATAAGCQLVASCDLAIAADNAKFATPGVNIGLFCSTPMVALSRNLPRKRAMEMLLTGDMIAAEEAGNWGLVNRVVLLEELANETRALAEKIASKSNPAVRIGKEAFWRQMEMGLSDAYDFANRVMVGNMLHDDAAEGIGAFFEKREPRWSDA